MTDKPLAIMKRIKIDDWEYDVIKVEDLKARLLQLRNELQKHYDLSDESMLYTKIDELLSELDNANCVSQDLRLAQMEKKE